MKTVLVNPELNPQVYHYLEEHLQKSLAHKTTLLTSPTPRRINRHLLKRRMSVRGAVKKTRSINVDGKLTYSVQYGFATFDLTFFFLILIYKLNSLSQCFYLTAPF